MMLIAFLFAGFETTSVTFSLCVYYIAKYPEEMAKLQAEIDSVEEVRIENFLIKKKTTKI